MGIFDLFKEKGNRDEKTELQQETEDRKEFEFEKNYDYSVVPGSRARSQNLGYLLEVNQIDRKTVKQLLQKCVGITAAYDGLYRPTRK